MLLLPREKIAAGRLMGVLYASGRCKALVWRLGLCHRPHRHRLVHCPEQQGLWQQQLPQHRRAPFLERCLEQSLERPLERCLQQHLVHLSTRPMVST